MIEVKKQQSEPVEIISIKDSTQISSFLQQPLKAKKNIPKAPPKKSKPAVKLFERPARRSEERHDTKSVQLNPASIGIKKSKRSTNPKDIFEQRFTLPEPVVEKPLSLDVFSLAPKPKATVEELQVKTRSMLKKQKNE